MTNSDIKVLWAVDVTNIDDHDQSSLIITLSKLAEVSYVSVQIVYVMNSKNPDITYEYAQHQLHHYQRSAVQLANQHTLNNTKLKFEEYRIISQTENSLKKQATVFDEYAQETGADIIFICTAAKKGIQLFSLGSFTETLIADAKTPVLVFNPKSTAIDCTKMNILFPSDFGLNYLAAFKKVLTWAVFFNAEVTILHKAEKLLGLIPLITDEKIKHIQGTFEEVASQRNVKINFIIDPTLTDATDCIIENVQSGKYSFIAAVSQTGPLTSKLPENIKREIIRSSPIPVLSIRFHEKNKLQEALVGTTLEIDPDTVLT